MRQLTDEQITRIVSRGRAIGDATRVRILSVLVRGEQAVGEVAQTLATQQSTVSKHLQVLFNAGLVQRRREASTVIYSASATQLATLLEQLGARQTSSPSPGRPRIKAARGAKGFRTPRRRR